MSEKSSGSGLLIVGGLILGGIIIVYALKNRQQQIYQAPQSPPSPAFQTSDLITTLKPFIEDVVESAIKKTSMQILSPTNTYKNNEDRIVKRNADGFIESLKVIRHAEMINNASAKEVS